MTNSKHRLDDLCRFERGKSPTLKTLPGPYPLVVTAEFRRSADSWQLEGPAVCVPLISSTGHGDAALHRVHYQEGKFALANLLVALVPKNQEQLFAKYLYHLLMARKDELLVPLMLGTANVSLKERDIAGVEIQVPTLSVQRQTVERIEDLTAAINEARRLRNLAAKEAEMLMAGEERRIWADAMLVDAPHLESLTKFLARGKQSEQGESDHFLIKTQHVQQGRYIQTQMRLAAHAASRVKSEAIVQDGDILMRNKSSSSAGGLTEFDSSGNVGKGVNSGDHSREFGPEHGCWERK
jgi:hypothetical protein